MSGYIARLMRQSGVKIADAGPSNVPSAPPVQESVAASSAADVIERETQRADKVSEGTPMPPAGPPEILVRPRAESGPDQAQPPSEGHREEATGLESPLAAQPTDIPATSIALEPPFVSIGKKEPRSESKSQMPSAKVDPSLAQPVATGDLSISAPTSQEIVHEVMAWVADSGSTAEHVTLAGRQARPTAVPSRALPMQAVAVDPATQPQLNDNTTSPIRDDSEPGQLLEPETVRLAAAQPSAPTLSRDEPWSVHIDTIHLTIEEPAAKPSPPPVAPRAAPPAAPARAGFSPSRLRRHYLRTF